MLLPSMASPLANGSIKCHTNISRSMYDFDERVELELLENPFISAYPKVVTDNKYLNYGWKVLAKLRNIEA